MTVIARWWLIVGTDGHAYEVRNEQPDTSPEGIDFPFEDRVVEVAPVNQPLGAVDRIKTLRGNVDPASGDDRESAYAHGYLAGVTDALERLGGQ